jgi:hypothetical protein
MRENKAFTTEEVRLIAGDKQQSIFAQLFVDTSSIIERNESLSERVHTFSMLYSYVYFGYQHEWASCSRKSNSKWARTSRTFDRCK